MKRVIILIWDAAAILKICSEMQLQLIIQNFLRLCYLSAGIITCRIEINVWYWSFINANKNDTDKEFPNVKNKKYISLNASWHKYFLTSFFWEVSIWPLHPPPPPPPQPHLHISRRTNPIFQYQYNFMQLLKNYLE